MVKRSKFCRFPTYCPGHVTVVNDPQRLQKKTKAPAASDGDKLQFLSDERSSLCAAFLSAQQRRLARPRPSRLELTLHTPSNMIYSQQSKAYHRFLRKLSAAEIVQGCLRRDVEKRVKHAVNAWGKVENEQWTTSGIDKPALYMDMCDMRQRVEAEKSKS